MNGQTFSQNIRKRGKSHHYRTSVVSEIPSPSLSLTLCLLGYVAIQPVFLRRPICNGSRHTKRRLLVLCCRRKCLRSVLSLCVGAVVLLSIPVYDCSSREDSSSSATVIFVPDMKWLRSRSREGEADRSLVIL